MVEEYVKEEKNEESRKWKRSTGKKESLLPEEVFVYS